MKNTKSMGLLAVISSFTCSAGIGLFVRAFDQSIREADLLVKLVACAAVICLALASLLFLIIGIKLIQEDEPPACVGCGKKPNSQLSGRCKPCTGETNA